MWKNYSADYLKNNRARGGSIMAAVKLLEETKPGLEGFEVGQVSELAG